MIKEFCAENLTDIEAAIRAGAQRIELCDNLAVGGTTPSYGVIEVACSLAKSYQVSVMTMIRPRGGDFHYSESELAIMKRDIAMAREAGTDGYVFGCLTADQLLDESAMEELLQAAGRQTVVFHMAFDQIPREHQLTAMDWLVEHGVTRILTHGGPADQPIEAHLDWLRTLCQHAVGRIEILIGGGVTADNAAELLAFVGTDQAHGTKIVEMNMEN